MQRNKTGNMHICKKKKLHIYKVFEKKSHFFGIFFATELGVRCGCNDEEVIVKMDSPCWDLLRTHIFPRTRELPQFPISPKPLFLSKNRLRNPPKPILKQNKKLCTYAQKFFLHICKVFGKKKSFFRKFFFATGLIFERFLAPRSRFFEKVNGVSKNRTENRNRTKNPHFPKPQNRYRKKTARTATAKTETASYDEVRWSVRFKTETAPLQTATTIKTAKTATAKNRNMRKMLLNFAGTIMLFCGESVGTVSVDREEEEEEEQESAIRERERERERESGSFKNSYIPENPRTSKPLTFSKNDFGRLKIAQIQARSQKKISEKMTFFFKKLCICVKKNYAHMHILSFCFKNVQIPNCFLKFFYRSLYNKYLKGFVKKIEKKRIIWIMTVLEGHEVGFLKEIMVWEI
ncbi:hypothetical protein LXL04_023983 [Taraxacum kok-saghyz]